MVVRLSSTNSNFFKALHKFKCLAVRLDKNSKYGKALNCSDYINYDEDNEYDLYKPEYGSGDIPINTERYSVHISDD